MSHDERDTRGRAFDILTEALQLIGSEGITRQDAVPVLVDFTTAVGLIVGREAGAEAMIIRIRNRIADWKAGNFPSLTDGTH